ncbi:unnamed protein product [Rhizopus microsporus]
MVRFKHCWILFQVNQDPVIDNGQIVYPRTSLRLNDQMISRAIYNQIEITMDNSVKDLAVQMV